MKKILAINYWFMSIAWALCLDSNVKIGVFIGLAMTIMLSAYIKIINYWRTLAKGLFTYIVVFYLYTKTNISFFFPDLYLFLVLMCFNSAITNELLIRYKTKYVLPFVIILAFGQSFLSLLTLVVPESLYSIFTKERLYILGSFIFLPYLITPCICVIRRYIENTMKEKMKIVSKNIDINI